MTDARDKILTCACELYLEDGFEGFSMRKLARAVGVTAPALYRHYESKEQLLLDVVGEAHEVMFGYLYRALSGATPEERFQMAGGAYLDFALEQPRYFQIRFAFTDAMGLDEAPDELIRHNQASRQFWLDRVREVMDSGFLEEDDPEMVGFTCWALADGLISIYQRGCLPLAEEAFREVYGEAFGRILAGMASAEAAREIRRELKPASWTALLEASSPDSPAGPSSDPMHPSHRRGDSTDE